MRDRTCYSRSIMLFRPRGPERRGCRAAGSRPPVSLGPHSGGAGPRTGRLLQHGEWMGEQEALTPPGAHAATSDDGRCRPRAVGTRTLIPTNEEAMSEGIDGTADLVPLRGQEDFRHAWPQDARDRGDLYNRHRVF